MRCQFNHAKECTDENQRITLRLAEQRTRGAKAALRLAAAALTTEAPLRRRKEPSFTMIIIIPTRKVKITLN